MCKANCTNITKIEFIGHSLGAQVVAAAAKVLIDCGKKPPMMTGLDPAGPGFYFLGPIFVCGLNLNADLADQVVIFHTDRGRFGIFIREGSLDFDVNCGIQYQPGCKVDTKPSQPPIGSTYFSFIHLSSYTSRRLRSWRVEAFDKFHTNFAHNGEGGAKISLAGTLAKFI